VVIGAHAKDCMREALEPDYGPPEPEIVEALVHGTSPALWDYPTD
jgi:hypothetical protein